MKELIFRTRINIYHTSELPSEYKELEAIVRELPRLAYAPYSHFNVGAAVLLENGNIVTGTNQENIAYPSGLCAERVALFSVGSLHPNIPAKAIAIAAETGGKRVEMITPCGACRQVMLETQNRSGVPLVVLLCGPELVYVAEDARALLPLSFDGWNLPD
ncbi:MAG: cytidine deaminase [Tannerellaceae bacterium]|jgi:cytidine deaminase|nr:cytidine deaminase [Tannerellaceae bacterium]